jgi:phospholipid transport system substrate-binding protein
LAVALACSAAAAELDTSTPPATIETLHAGLIAVAAKHPGAALDERYRELVPLIAATHDLPYIAEFALRRQWPALSPADRERFIAAFTRLSVTTYASRFKNVTAKTFAIAGSSPPAGGRAQVTAAITRAEGADVSLEYSLHESGGGWKIINIIADGVSDLALKRAEYQRILANGTIDDLIAELDSQTARLD